MQPRIGLSFTLMHIHVEAQPRSEFVDTSTEFVKLSRAGRNCHEKREHEVRTHHDLLDVDDDDVVISEDLADATGNSRTIWPGECKQEGVCGCVVHRAQTSAGRPPPSA